MPATNISDLQGFLKPVFGSLQQLLAETSICQDRFKFDVANNLGGYFQEPLVTRPSWGVTFLGTDGAGAAGTGIMASAIPSKTASLQVTSTSIMLTDQSSFALLDRSSSDGGAANRKAFMSDAKLTALGLTMQMRNLIEIGCLCGQQGIGTIASTTGTTTQVWTISAATLRPGILAILEGAKLDLYAADLSTPVANAQAVTVTGVDVVAGTITVATPSNPTSNVAGLVIFLSGANSSGAFQEMVGLRKQVGALTGTIFNIDKATYSAYRGNTSSTVGAISAGSLLALAALAVNRGMQGKMIAIMSPKAWMVLNSRNIGAQVFDSSYSVSKAKEGTDAIEIRGQGVVIEAVPHPYQADGEVLMVPLDYVKRIGSAYENSTDDKARDISFTVPGSDEQYLTKVPGYAVCEMVVRTDQQILDTRPAWSVLGTGVTY